MTFVWLNEPTKWSGDASDLSLTTEGATDFWRETFYGFTRDSGHAFLAPISGDFSVSATITGEYEELYDQAGLMLRVDERNWIKTGVEYTDGMMHFSVVVTNTVSDWSVIPLRGASPASRLNVRLTRHDDAIRVQYAIDDAKFQMARLAPFTAADAQVGVMACSPEREGFRARFRDLAIGPAIARRLHED